MQLKEVEFLLSLLPSKNNSRNKKIGKKKKKKLPYYFKLHASAAINVFLNPIVLIQRQVIQVA